jgi:predicted phosphodiesterase
MSSHEWSDKDALNTFKSLMLPLCEATTRALKKDDMLIKLQSPVYVLGDLHGNYKDLQFFAKNFWNMGLDMNPAKFLFLGDYVDRGPHSLELVAYLFCLKLLNPNQVYLLRGNHEFPQQNGDTDYNPCFLQSIQQLYPRAKKEASKIWDAYNDTFEWMPIAATIDDKIFCCHGGVPRIVEQLKQKKDSSTSAAKTQSLLNMIAQIPRPLTEDLVMSEDSTKLALDLLWADPATSQEEEEKLDEGSLMFGPNDRGDDVVVFGTKAVEAFVKSTKCTHLLRAHQPPHHGFEYSKEARIVTVFSSSHYCGSFNSAAIVLVHNSRLRVAITQPTKRSVSIF